MAELFLARTETELGATRLAVVKLILPAFANDQDFADMLIHEAKLAARLSHRHIVQVLDLGRDRDRAIEDPPSLREPSFRDPDQTFEPDGEERRLYIAMEYVEGFDLNALLRKCTEQNEGLPAEHALGIVADVLEGLDYAHRRTDDRGQPLGIVHRDVSPSNVLISYEGEVKLCDFGIAHAHDLTRREGDAAKNEALKGKAGYMSPEHARGESLDCRADVFAAGIILWELLSGRRLYKPRSATPLLEQAREADIPPIPDKGLPNHEELERIVRRALAKNRDERYPSASAFGRDLESYLAGAGLLSSRLKLGEWLSSTFGTRMIEERRASERKLPKSAPPPRSSSAIRLANGGSSPSIPALKVPTLPPVPQDLVHAVQQEESAPLFAKTDEELISKNKLIAASLTTTLESELLKNGIVLNDASEHQTSDMTGSAPPPPAAEIITCPPRPAATKPLEITGPPPAAKPLEITGPLPQVAIVPPNTPSQEPNKSELSVEKRDEEMLSWARKRGVVSFFFFFAIALIVTIIWYVNR